MSESKSEWLVYAIASGACAALNGVFAKLTTTTLTSSWATAISRLLGVKHQDMLFEFLVRGFFFLMNLAFNGVMWGLFTRALTLSSSTVRVSVINTSTNFMITAILGAVVFSEELPAQWWLGASMLVVGSVIIGRREEDVGSETATFVRDKFTETSNAEVKGLSSAFQLRTSERSKETERSNRRRTGKDKPNDHNG